MKYSLRSLFVVVTLVAVVLGSWPARVAYLRRCEALHEREWIRLDNCRRLTGKKEFADKAWEHMLLAARFRMAVEHPWAMVDESAEATLEEAKEANSDFRKKVEAGIVYPPNSSALAPNPPKP
jgi:hypothetical protein